MSAQTLINVNGTVVDAGSVTKPNSRKFRDAWQLNGMVIDVDIPVARDIVRANLRQDRMAAFDPFDNVSVPLTRKATHTPLSQAEKDQVAAAEVEAQKLRDAPDHASINAATTAAQLEVITLDTVTV